MNKAKMKKKTYVTNEERRKLQRVMKAFTELYRKEDIMVFDAGRYGVVKVQYYKNSFGFTDVYTFTDSKELFKDLWQDWRNTYLLAWAKGTPIAELSYKDMFQFMPLKNQKLVMKKKRYFEKKAGQRKKKYRK